MNLVESQLRRWSNPIPMTLITPRFAIGDRNDPNKWFKHLDAFLCCAAELPLPSGKPGFHLALMDGMPVEHVLLEAAFAFLDEQLALRHTVLVYCGHGFSRSVSVLTGYLAWKSAEPPDRVLEQVRKLRPEICPSVTTYESIIRYLALRRPIA